MLTKQHYKAIAEIIKSNATKEKVSARLVCADIASDLSRYFKADNERFNPAKFFEACSID